MSGFDDFVAVVGLLLAVGALISGLVKRSFLSLTALYVLAGFAFGKAGLNVIDLDPHGGFVQALAIVALIVLLFRDGLEVEAEMLQRAWRVPLRTLLVAMPVTGGLVALAAKGLTELSWKQSVLLGALLSPTDPVLSSSVITNPRVPRLVRHSLNLESGLNDGLALAPVLVLSAALGAHTAHGIWWQFLLKDVSVGLASGLVVGFVGARLLPRGRALGHEITPHQKSLYALGVAFGAYGFTTSFEPVGNGFIAVFVAAIVLGILRPDVRESFEHRSEDVIEVVKLAVFVVFGSLFTFHGIDGAAVGIALFTLLVARPVAVFGALVGTRLDRVTKAFIGWFGPKGVATMTYSLFVLGQGVAAGRRLFDIAALTVFVSIFAHGVTDTAGANWIGDRAEERDRARRPLEREPERAAAL